MSISKRLLFASAATLAVASAAQAADAVLPAPVIPVAPVVDTSAFDWSGFYAGIGGSAGWHGWTYEEGGDSLVFDPEPFSGELVLGGNAQFGSFVVGLEATAGFYSASISGEADIDPANPDIPEELREFLEDVDGEFTGTSTGWTAGLEARAGYLVTPTFLLYGSLGVTGIYSDNNTSVTYTDPGSGDEVTEEAEIFGNVFGSVGVGAEFAVADNISLDLQYKYYGFSILDFVEDSGLSSAGHGVSAQILFHF